MWGAWDKTGVKDAVYKNAFTPHLIAIPITAVHQLLIGVLTMTKCQL